jgi:gamma-glutamylcyclotransferase (GGCT)/AIG2-like uncharacterized protein YtfP
VKNQIEHVFVYGSLKRGESLYLLEPLVDLRLEVVPAQIQPAVLYDLGPFPGMVLKTNGGVVMGEVHRFHQLIAVLEILDEIEEYYGEGDPHNLYRRVEHEAELLNEGGLVSCWLYEFMGPLEGASLIEGGVWNGRVR